MSHQLESWEKIEFLEYRREKENLIATMEIMEITEITVIMVIMAVNMEAIWAIMGPKVDFLSQLEVQMGLHQGAEPKLKKLRCVRLSTIPRRLTQAVN